MELAILWRSVFNLPQKIDIHNMLIFTLYTSITCSVLHQRDNITQTSISLEITTSNNCSSTTSFGLDHGQNECCWLGSVRRPISSWDGNALNKVNGCWTVENCQYTAQLELYPTQLRLFNWLVTDHLTPYNPTSGTIYFHFNHSVTTAESTIASQSQINFTPPIEVWASKIHEPLVDSEGNTYMRQYSAAPE